MVSILHENQQQQEEEQQNQELPRDTICEILTRVPLLVLVTLCSLVCEDWNHYLHQAHFQAIHSQRTIPISGFFVQTQRRCKYYTTYVSSNPNATDSTLDSCFHLSNDMRVVSSSPSGGLLCCIDYSKTPYRYYVCRPAKGECRSIPNPKTRFIDQKVAIVPTGFNPLSYKIVRFSGYGPAYHVEIFDLEQLSWKQFQDVHLPDGDYLDASEQPTVFVNGFLYCLTSYGKIFAFNIADGSWQTIELPIQHNEQNGMGDQRKLTEYKGSLAIMLNVNYCIETWVFGEKREDVEQELQDAAPWKMAHRVEISEDLRNFSILDINSKKGAVVMSDGLGSIAWYHLETRTYTREKNDIYPGRKTIFHAFQADLNSCM